MLRLTRKRGENLKSCSYSVINDLHRSHDTNITPLREKQSFKEVYIGRTKAEELAEHELETIRDFGRPENQPILSSNSDFRPMGKY